MPVVLICAGESVVQELAGSAVHRDGLERQVFGDANQAAAAASGAKPALIVVDRDLPRSEYLIQKLRGQPATQHVSIVVVARGEMKSEELGLLSAGANAVLRLPPTPEWDARIARLLRVPTRKQTRVPVTLDFEASLGSERVKGNVVNLSLTGMLVECKAALAIGSELAFAFHLMGFEVSTGDVKGNGRVVRMAAADRYGVEFTSLDEMGREMLRRFLLVP